MDDKKTKPSLSSDFAELEALVAEFESGEVDVEAGVAKFKRGAELAKSLKARLSEIENEITEVKASFVDPASHAEE